MIETAFQSLCGATSRDKRWRVCAVREAVSSLSVLSGCYDMSTQIAKTEQTGMRHTYMQSTGHGTGRKHTAHHRAFALQKMQNIIMTDRIVVTSKSKAYYH